MTGYTSVLVPTDGSDGSEVAAAAGLDIADRFDAAVHALYVVDERRVLDEFDLAVEAAEAEAERALESVQAAGADRGLAVENHLRRGVPHREILEAIEAYGIDLVVMGTRGRHGIERLLHLGSVTERVVRSSPVQVLCVPLRDGAPPA